MILQDMLFRSSNSLFGYLTAIVGIGVATGVLLIIQPFVNSTTAAALGLLIVVLTVATVFGSRPALLASILGVLCFNFFSCRPYIL